jgi:hypothetical protein
LTATAHTFQVGDTVVITGVEADLNGTFQITAVTTDTFSYKTDVPSNNISSQPYPLQEAQQYHFVVDSLVLLVMLQMEL